MLGANLLEQAQLVADANANERAVQPEKELFGLAAQAGRRRARDTAAMRSSPLSRRDVARLLQRRLDAVDELRDRALLDGVLAERGQHVRDVLHERPVRPDDEHAARACRSRAV